MGFEGVSSMSDQQFLKCNCQSCGSPIEFPPQGVGIKLDCPHCGQQTLLSESAATLEADLPLPQQSPDDAIDAPAPTSESLTGLQPSPSGAAPSPGRKSRLLAMALVLLVLAAVAGGVWYFMAGPGAKRPETPVAQKPEPPEAKKSEPKVIASAVPANTDTNTPAAEAADSGNSIESAQRPQKSIDDLKASAVTLEKAKAGSLIHAVGTIRNTSDQQRFGVRVELELTDARGNPAGKASDYTQVIEPRKEWRFRALVVDPKGSRAVTGKVSSIKEDN